MFNLILLFTTFLYHYLPSDAFICDGGTCTADESCADLLSQMLCVCDASWEQGHCSDGL